MIRYRVMTESPGAGFWLIKGDRTYVCGHCSCRIHTPDGQIYWSRSISTCASCKTIVHHECQSALNGAYADPVVTWLGFYARPLVCKWGDGLEGTYD